MPANLTPEYRAAEEAFRKARDPRERLERLREMLRTIPKHKGTDHLQGDIKRRIKEMSEELERPARGGARGGPPLSIQPEGARQLALIGPPNVGKSSLHARLTGSGAHAAAYPFTTRYPEPGMMRYEDISFQLVDLPALAPEQAVSWLATALETADAALLVVDLGEPRCVERAAAVHTLLRERRVTLTERWEPAVETGGRGRSVRAESFHAAACQQGGPRCRPGRRAAGVPRGRGASLSRARRLRYDGAGPGADRPLARRPSRHRARLHQGAGPAARPGSAVHNAAGPDRRGRRRARAQGPRAVAQVRARVEQGRLRRPARRPDLFGC